METVTEAGSFSGTGPEMTPELEPLLAQYSLGALSRNELERASGLWFGDILAALARRGLPLPRVDSSVHFNPAQQALYERVFG
jgi:hypothetical protein